MVAMSNPATEETPVSDLIYEESEAMEEALTIEERYAAIDAARERYHAYEAQIDRVMGELHEILTGDVAA